jgi:hypothetical protein
MGLVNGRPPRHYPPLAMVSLINALTDLEYPCQTQGYHSTLQETFLPSPLLSIIICPRKINTHATKMTRFQTWFEF